MNTTPERPIRIEQRILPCPSFGKKGYTIETRARLFGYVIGNDHHSAGTKAELRKSMDEAATDIRSRLIDMIGG